MRAIVAILLLVLGSPCAHAQRGYDRLIRDAVGEFDAGRWAEARALFEEAHALSPNARTLRGIGMCAFELREYDAAITALRGALESTERPLTRSQRQQVEELLERARGFIGRFFVVLEPAWATLRVDDAEPRFADDGAIVLDLGEHVLEASLEGHPSRRRRLTVRGREEEQVVLTVAPPAPRASAASELRVEPLAMLIAGGTLLVADAWAIGWVVERQSELDWCDFNGPTCRNRGTIGDQRDAAAVTALILGASALGLGLAGAMWWWLSGERPAASACTPRGPGVVCRF